MRHLLHDLMPDEFAELLVDPGEQAFSSEATASA